MKTIYNQCMFCKRSLNKFCYNLFEHLKRGIDPYRDVLNLFPEAKSYLTADKYICQECLFIIRSMHEFKTALFTALYGDDTLAISHTLQVFLSQLSPLNYDPHPDDEDSSDHEHETDEHETDDTDAYSCVTLREDDIEDVVEDNEEYSQDGSQQDNGSQGSGNEEEEDNEFLRPLDSVPIRHISSYSDNESRGPTPNSREVQQTFERRNRRRKRVGYNWSRRKGEQKSQARIRMYSAQSEETHYPHSRNSMTSRQSRKYRSADSGDESDDPRSRARRRFSSAVPQYDENHRLTNKLTRAVSRQQEEDAAILTTNERMKEDVVYSCVVNACLQSYNTFEELSEHAILVHEVESDSLKIEEYTEELRKYREDDDKKSKGERSSSRTRLGFPCLLKKCYKTFSNFEATSEHQITGHNLPAMFWCEECYKLKFYTHEELLFHNDQRHSFMINCLLCSKPMRNQRELQLHLENHKQFSFPCKFCDKFFLDYESLSNHRNTHKLDKRKTRIKRARRKTILERVNVRNSGDSNTSLSEEYFDPCNIRIQPGKDPDADGFERPPMSLQSPIPLPDRFDEFEYIFNNDEVDSRPIEEPEIQLKKAVVRLEKMTITPSMLNEDLIEEIDDDVLEEIVLNKEADTGGLNLVDIIAQEHLQLSHSDLEVGSVDISTEHIETTQSEDDLITKAVSTYSLDVIEEIIGNTTGRKEKTDDVAESGMDNEILEEPQAIEIVEAPQRDDIPKDNYDQENTSNPEITSSTSKLQLFGEEVQKSDKNYELSGVDQDVEQPTLHQTRALTRKSLASFEATNDETLHNSRFSKDMLSNQQDNIPMKEPMEETVRELLTSPIPTSNQSEIDQKREQTSRRSSRREIKSVENSSTTIATDDTEFEASTSKVGDKQKLGLSNDSGFERTGSSRSNPVIVDCVATATKAADYDKSSNQSISVVSKDVPIDKQKLKQTIESVTSEQTTSDVDTHNIGHKGCDSPTSDQINRRTKISSTRPTAGDATTIPKATTSHIHQIDVVRTSPTSDKIYQESTNESSPVREKLVKVVIISDEETTIKIKNSNRPIKEDSGTMTKSKQGIKHDTRLTDKDDKSDIPSQEVLDHKTSEVRHGPTSDKTKPKTTQDSVDNKTSKNSNSSDKTKAKTKIKTSTKTPANTATAFDLHGYGIIVQSTGSDSPTSDKDKSKTKTKSSTNRTADDNSDTSDINSRDRHTISKGSDRPTSDKFERKSKHRSSSRPIGVDSNISKTTVSKERDHPTTSKVESRIKTKTSTKSTEYDESDISKTSSRRSKLDDTRRSEKSVSEEDNKTKSSSKPTADDVTGTSKSSSRWNKVVDASRSGTSLQGNKISKETDTIELKTGSPNTKRKSTTTRTVDSPISDKIDQKAKTKNSTTRTVDSPTSNKVEHKTKSKNSNRRTSSSATTLDSNDAIGNKISNPTSDVSGYEKSHIAEDDKTDSCEIDSSTISKESTHPTSNKVVSKGTIKNNSNPTADGGSTTVTSDLDYVVGYKLSKERSAIPDTVGTKSRTKPTIDDDSTKSKETVGIVGHKKSNPTSDKIDTKFTNQIGTSDTAKPVTSGPSDNQENVETRALDTLSIDWIQKRKVRSSKSSTISDDDKKASASPHKATDRNVEKPVKNVEIARKKDRSSDLFDVVAKKNKQDDVRSGMKGTERRSETVVQDKQTTVETSGTQMGDRPECSKMQSTIMPNQLFDVIEVHSGITQSRRSTRSATRTDAKNETNESGSHANENQGMKLRGNRRMSAPIVDQTCDEEIGTSDVAVLKIDTKPEAELESEKYMTKKRKIISKLAKEGLLDDKSTKDDDNKEILTKKRKAMVDIEKPIKAEHENESNIQRSSRRVANFEEFAQQKMMEISHDSSQRSFKCFEQQQILDANIGEPTMVLDSNPQHISGSETKQEGGNKSDDKFETRVFDATVLSFEEDKAKVSDVATTSLKDGETKIDEVIDTIKNIKDKSDVDRILQKYITPNKNSDGTPKIEDCSPTDVIEKSKNTKNKQFETDFTEMSKTKQKLSRKFFGYKEKPAEEVNPKAPGNIKKVLKTRKRLNSYKNRANISETGKKLSHPRRKEILDASLGDKKVDKADPNKSYYDFSDEASEEVLPYNKAGTRDKSQLDTIAHSVDNEDDVLQKVKNTIQKLRSGKRGNEEVGVEKDVKSERNIVGKGKKPKTIRNRRTKANKQHPVETTSDEDAVISILNSKTSSPHKMIYNDDETAKTLTKAAEKIKKPIKTHIENIEEEAKPAGMRCRRSSSCYYQDLTDEDFDTLTPVKNILEKYGEKNKSDGELQTDTKPKRARKKPVKKSGVKIAESKDEEVTIKPTRLRSRQNSLFSDQSDDGKLKRQATRQTNKRNLATDDTIKSRLRQSMSPIKYTEIESDPHSLSPSHIPIANEIVVETTIDDIVISEITTITKNVATTSTPMRKKRVRKIPRKYEFANVVRFAQDVKEPTASDVDGPSKPKKGKPNDDKGETTVPEVAQPVVKGKQKRLGMTGIVQRVDKTDKAGRSKLKKRRGGGS